MAEQDEGNSPINVHDEEAKKARQAAREERARARALKKQQEEAAVEENAETEPVKPHSPEQQLLDEVVSLIKREVADAAVVEAYINELDRKLPCMVIERDYWLRVAKLLKDHERLNLHYLRNVAGVDQTTHMEVVYHLVCLSVGQDYFIKVKTDRDQPSVPSVAGIWRTADWNEREIYDLLGVDFPGHPNLTRIMMPDDWIGHPLRKDYEAYDPEV